MKTKSAIPPEVFQNARYLDFFDEHAVFHHIILTNLGDEADTTNKPKTNTTKTLEEAFYQIALECGVYPTVIFTATSICVIDIDYVKGRVLSHCFFDYASVTYTVDCSTPALKYTVEKRSAPTPMVPEYVTPPTDDKGKVAYEANVASYVNSHERIHGQATAMGLVPVIVTSQYEAVWFGYAAGHWEEPITLYFARNIQQWTVAVSGFMGLAEVGVPDAQVAGTSVSRTTDVQSTVGARMETKAMFSGITSILRASENAARTFNNAHPSGR